MQKTKREFFLYRQYLIIFWEQLRIVRWYRQVPRYHTLLSYNSTVPYCRYVGTGIRYVGTIALPPSPIYTNRILNSRAIPTHSFSSPIHQPFSSPLPGVGISKPVHFITAFALAQFLSYKQPGVNAEHHYGAYLHIVSQLQHLNTMLHYPFKLGSGSGSSLS